LFSSGENCGNAFQIAGATTTTGERLDPIVSATFIEIVLTGLEPSRVYYVKYYVNSQGKSERRIKVTVTGDTSNPDESYESDNNSIIDFYVEKIRAGIADSNGILSVIFANNQGSSSRMTAIDNLSITAGPEL